MGKLKIGGVPEHFNYFWHLSGTKEIMRSHGFYYEWTDYPGGTGAMSAALENGEIDIAIMLTEGAIAAVSMQKQFQIRFPLVMSPLLWGVFTSANRTTALPENFAQSKFAISRPYSGSHLMAMFLAQRENNVLGDANFVISKDLEGARKALAEGDADYFLWEKYMTRPLVHKGEFTMTGEISAPWPAFVFVSRREQPENIDFQALQDAVFECTSDYLQQSREELLAGICSNFNLLPADAESWLNEVKYYDNNFYWKDRLTAAVIIMHSKKMIATQPELWQLI